MPPRAFFASVVTSFFYKKKVKKKIWSGISVHSERPLPDKSENKEFALLSFAPLGFKHRAPLPISHPLNAAVVHMEIDHDGLVVNALAALGLAL